MSNDLIMQNKYNNLLNDDLLSNKAKNILKRLTKNGSELNIRCMELIEKLDKNNNLKEYNDDGKRNNNYDTNTNIDSDIDSDIDEIQISLGKRKRTN